MTRAEIEKHIERTFKTDGLAIVDIGTLAVAADGKTIVETEPYLSLNLGVRPDEIDDFCLWLKAWRHAT